MRLRSLLIGLLVLAAAGMSWAGDAPGDSAAAAQWIWYTVERQEGRTAYFRREFSADKQVTSAVLRAVGESADLQIYLNGSLLAEMEAYDPLWQLDMVDRIRAGGNVLAVQSTSCAGPAALFLQLDLIFADRSRQTIVSDERWMAAVQVQPGWNSSSLPSGGWQPATSLGSVGPRIAIADPWRVDITAVDDYEQWRQALGTQQGTDPAAFLLSPGFEIQLVRSALPGEDSWVSMAFDPQGRVVIAKERKGLLRMTLSDDGRQVTGAELIDDELEECRGLLFAFGDLFANANNSKGLFRLRGRGPDRFERPELLYGSTGDVGHGRNDIALGPDHKIYMIHGDAVDLPQKSLDYTSPFREARRGTRTSEGHLLRIDPQGGTVELLASGLRNPFGIDFNPAGELFTYDADAEYDMGAPWYRPTRVDHLVIGGDYGWRGVTKQWPPYYPDHPDNALPNLDIGKGSPTAVKFGSGSSFPSKFRDALFILDWAYGRILAVHLTPRGSSYLLTAETFLKGRPLNVTDLDFASDGSMYFVTGGRGTQSALYRVRYVGAEPPAEAAASTQQQARAAFAETARGLRHELESQLCKKIDAETFARTWQLLASEDPWIRHAARNVIERQPVALWQDRALAEPQRTAAAGALLALARSQIKPLRPRILARLNELDWASASRSDRTTASYAYWICLSEPSDLDAALLTEVTARLESRYPDRSYAVNRLLSEILVRVESRDLVTKTMRLLKSATDQSQQMHYLFVLRNARRGWTASDHEDYFDILSQTDHFLGGAGMGDFLAAIRSEAIAALTAEERERLGPRLEQRAEAAAEDGSPQRPVVQKWTFDALADILQPPLVPANVERGQAMFAVASCIKCHRFAGRGTPVGPDLTSVSSRFSRRDLLEAIITPSKIVPDSYRSLQIVTRDGRSYTGQVAPGGDYRSSVLRLATNPLQPFAVTEIAKSDIESQTTSPVSWMPEGLLDTLTKDEILSLLTYLEAGGQSQP